MRVRDWSVAVKARDGRCVRCGAVDNLHAHHTQYPRYVVENGETLCKPCLRKEYEVSRKRVRGKPQRRTLEKWLAR